MITAVNILRSSYPDVVDACEKLAVEEQRDATQIAARMLRKVLDLPDVKQTSVADNNITSQSECQQQ